MMRLSKTWRSALPKPSQIHSLSANPTTKLESYPHRRFSRQQGARRVLLLCRRAT